MWSVYVLEGIAFKCLKIQDILWKQMYVVLSTAQTRPFINPYIIYKAEIACRSKLMPD